MSTENNAIPKHAAYSNKKMFMLIEYNLKIKVSKVEKEYRSYPLQLKFPP